MLGKVLTCIQLCTGTQLCSNSCAESLGVLGGDASITAWKRSHVRQSCTHACSVHVWFVDFSMLTLWDVPLFNHVEFRGFTLWPITNVHLGRRYNLIPTHNNMLPTHNNYDSCLFFFEVVGIILLPGRGPSTHSIPVPSVSFPPLLISEMRFRPELFAERPVSDAPNVLFMLP